MAPAFVCRQAYICCNVCQLLAVHQGPLPRYYDTDGCSTVSTIDSLCRLMTTMYNSTMTAALVEDDKRAAGNINNGYP